MKMAFLVYRNPAILAEGGFGAPAFNRRECRLIRMLGASIGNRLPLVRSLIHDAVFDLAGGFEFANQLEQLRVPRTALR